MKKRISVVAPVYNESASIREFQKELVTQLKKLSYEWEIIFVNDGSQDDSFEILKKFAKDDDRIRVLNFSRNFGHQVAISAGIDFAEGDAVIIMDSDLQDPPRVLLDLLKKWEEGGEVVYAQRRTRKDTFFKKLTANGFYRLLAHFSDIRIPRDTGDFRLLDRRVVLSIRDFREKNRFMRGLTSFVGFRQECVKFDRDARFAGETHYPMKKMLKLAFDGITSFSVKPLRLITRLGFLAVLVSLVGIVYALFMKFFQPDLSVSGWTLMIIAILFLGGVQMLMLGIIGEYVGRIYTEVQNRPLYIVDQKINFDEK